MDVQDSMAVWDASSDKGKKAQYLGMCGALNSAVADCRDRYDEMRTWRMMALGGWTAVILMLLIIALV